MSFEIGSRVQDYEILGELGAGGMGKVYKVRNVISDRVEAMKVLLPDLAGQQELGSRFLREIKLLASLNHPHIAALHTALSAENQLLMVMEFVEGSPLDERLRAGRIPLPEVFRYMDQMLSALGYAHHQGIIHRDIKPSNIMLTSDGNIKLMDFGIARAATDSQLTRTGATLGSLHYMSPEQLTGDAMDARSDLYSLGVSFYEMATGQRPFEGGSEYSLMVAKVQQPPRAPVEIDPAIPKGLNDLILTSLARNPAQRFQSADAFRSALQSTARSLKIALPAEGFTGGAVHTLVSSGEAAQASAGPPPSHRSLYMALGALIAVAILVAGAVELPRFFRARASSPTSVAPAASRPATQPAPDIPVPTSSAPAASSASTSPSPSHNPAAAPDARRVSASRRAQPLASQKSVPAASSVSAPQAHQEDASQANSTQSGAASTAPSAAAASQAAEAKALQAARDRMDMLSGRANAVKASIQNLQQQEASAGASLRPDMVAAESLMERYMDEADSALNAGDPASARHYQDLAEHEIDKLENFLGQ